MKLNIGSDFRPSATPSTCLNFCDLQPLAPKNLTWPQPSPRPEYAILSDAILIYFRRCTARTNIISGIKKRSFPFSRTRYRYLLHHPQTTNLLIHNMRFLSFILISISAGMASAACAGGMSPDDPSSCDPVLTVNVSGGTLRHQWSGLLRFQVHMQASFRYWCWSSSGECMPGLNSQLGVGEMNGVSTLLLGSFNRTQRPFCRTNDTVFFE